MKRTPLHRKTPLRRSKRTRPPIPRKLIQSLAAPSSVTEQMRSALGDPAPMFREISPRKRSKYARRPRDMPRMLWTKHQPCAVGSLIGVELWLSPVPPGRCSGPVEAHHAGVRGVGQKATDDTVIPLCAGHHRALTDRAGAFAGWPRGAVKRWEMAMVALYQERYRLEHPAFGEAALY